MKILIIDNNIMPNSWGCENLRRYARLVPGATLAVRRAPHGDLPESPGDFDRIIVSGSATPATVTQEEAPWINPLLEFIRKAVDARKPFLGVCFGHQMLARALGGRGSVRRAPRAEFGWTKIEVTGELPILKGLAREFYSFSAHQDEVATLPPEARSVAASAHCAIQAYGLASAPAFGIQFHPEKDRAECEESLVRWRRDFKARETLHPTQTKKFYRPEIAETIFGNFFTL